MPKRRKKKRDDKTSISDDSVGTGVTGVLSGAPSLVPPTTPPTNKMKLKSGGSRSRIFVPRGMGFERYAAPTESNRLPAASDRIQVDPFSGPYAPGFNPPRRPVGPRSGVGSDSYSGVGGPTSNESPAVYPYRKPSLEWIQKNSTGGRPQNIPRSVTPGRSGPDPLPRPARRIRIGPPSLMESDQFIDIPGEPRNYPIDTRKPEPKPPLLTPETSIYPDVESGRAMWRRSRRKFTINAIDLF